MKRCSQRVIKSRHKRASAGRSLIEEELVFSEGGVGSSRTALDCGTGEGRVGGRATGSERPPASSRFTFELPRTRAR